jgi:hypothetical protein
MNFNSVATTRNAWFAIPVIFFPGFGFFVLLLIMSITGIWPVQYQIMNFHVMYNAIFLLFCLVSFSGSIKLLDSYQEKPSYTVWIIPFCLVTACGLLFSGVRVVLSGTTWEWPLVPVTDLLLTMTLLALAPAMTLLLVPFLRQMQSPPKISFAVMTLLSLITSCILILILGSDILPLLDPEFIWSEFWDFGSPHFTTELVSSGFWHFGNTNPLTSLLSSFYLVFGMPFAGLLLISIIKKIQLSTPSPDGGN